MTKVIAKGRGEGKTTELIKLSAETGKYILVANQQRAMNISDMAGKMGLYIPFPVTVQEALKYSFRGTFIKEILVDDAEDVLQSLFRVNINAITVTTEEECPFSIRAWIKKSMKKMGIGHKHKMEITERSNIIQYDDMGYPLRLCICTCVKCGASEQMWLDTLNRTNADDVVIKWRKVENGSINS